MGLYKALKLLFFCTLESFFLSHGVSFSYNFVGKQDFLRTEPEGQMMAPYKRIALMHFTLLFGGIGFQTARR